MSFFIIALIILWVLWVLTGGPANVENHTRPFLEQPEPVDTGRVYTLEELRERNKR